MSYPPGEPPAGWLPPSDPAQPTWQPPGSQPDPGQQPGWGQQPGYGQQPGWGQQPGYGAGPGGGPGWSTAPKPGVVPLRPLGLGEILDGAFTTIRLYPKATLGLSAVVATLGALAQFFLTLALRNSSYDNTWIVLTAALAGLLINGLAILVLTGMLTIVISEAVLGRPIEIGQVWARVRPRILSLIGASILVGLVSTLGTIACIVPGIYLYVALSLTTPALILEGQNISAAMSRSRALVSGDWWRVFGILVLASIIASIIGGVISLPFSLASGVSSTFDFTVVPHQPGTGALFLAAVGQILSNTITAPITAGVTALLYIDRRMRREGLDVALARAAAPPAPPSAGW